MLKLSEKLKTLAKRAALAGLIGAGISLAITPAAAQMHGGGGFHGGGGGFHGAASTRRVPQRRVSRGIP